MTNDKTAQIGIYQITKKQMAFDLGYSIESVNSLLERFIRYDMVRYNPETREIAIKNWGKYNLVRGGKPMIDCVEKEFKDVKDLSLIPYVGENVANKGIKEIYDTYHDTFTGFSEEDNTQSFRKNDSNMNEYADNDKPNQDNNSYDTSTTR